MKTMYFVIAIGVLLFDLKTIRSQFRRVNPFPTGRDFVGITEAFLCPGDRGGEYEGSPVMIAVASDNTMVRIRQDSPPEVLPGAQNTIGSFDWTGVVADPSTGTVVVTNGHAAGVSHDCGMTWEMVRLGSSPPPSRSRSSLHSSEKAENNGMPGPFVAYVVRHVNHRFFLGTEDFLYVSDEHNASSWTEMGKIGNLYRWYDLVWIPEISSYVATACSGYTEEKSNALLVASEDHSANNQKVLEWKLVVVSPSGCPTEGVIGLAYDEKTSNLILTSSWECLEYKQGSQGYVANVHSLGSNWTCTIGLNRTYGRRSPSPSSTLSIRQLFPLLHGEKEDEKGTSSSWMGFGIQGEKEKDIFTGPTASLSEDGGLSWNPIPMTGVPKDARLLRSWKKNDDLKSIVTVGRFGSVASGTFSSSSRQFEKMKSWNSGFTVEDIYQQFVDPEGNHVLITVVVEDACDDAAVPVGIRFFVRAPGSQVFKPLPPQKPLDAPSAFARRESDGTLLTIWDSYLLGGILMAASPPEYKYEVAFQPPIHDTFLNSAIWVGNSIVLTVMFGKKECGLYFSNENLTEWKFSKAPFQCLEAPVFPSLIPFVGNSPQDGFIVDSFYEHHSYHVDLKTLNWTLLPTEFVPWGMHNVQYSPILGRYLGVNWDGLYQSTSGSLSGWTKFINGTGVYTVSRKGDILYVGGSVKCIIWEASSGQTRECVTEGIRHHASYTSAVFLPNGDLAVGGLRGFLMIQKKE